MRMSPEAGAECITLWILVESQLAGLTHKRQSISTEPLLSAEQIDPLSVTAQTVISHSNLSVVQVPENKIDFG